MEESVNTIKEIQITVPWGVVAAKTWGDEKDALVLCFHGLLDNAGTFDHLIPLLPAPFYYVCVDLPGHGKSSHFPPHLPVHSLNYLVVYKLLVKHFNRGRYIFMGHSYGGQISVMFAQLYPHFVEKLILLDTVAFLPVATSRFVDYLQERVDGFFLIQDKLQLNKEPTYTYSEALAKVQNGRNYGLLSVEAAAALLQRAIVPAEGGRYKLSIDQRLKFFINPLSDFRYISEVMRKHPLLCPALIVLGSESTLQQTYMEPVLKVLRGLKNVSIKIAVGGHDAHSCNPENVAPYVHTFLLNKKGGL